MRYILILLLAVVAGCASEADIEREPMDRGETRVFQHPPEAVLAATKQTLAKLEVRTEKEASNEIVGRKGYPMTAVVDTVRIDILPSPRGSVVRILPTSETMGLKLPSVAASGLSLTSDIFTGISVRLRDTP